MLNTSLMGQYVESNDEQIETGFSRGCSLCLKSERCSDVAITNIRSFTEFTISRHHCKGVHVPLVTASKYVFSHGIRVRVCASSVQTDFLFERRLNDHVYSIVAEFSSGERA